MRVHVYTEKTHIIFENLCVYIYICTCVYIFVRMERERERQFPVSAFGYHSFGLVNFHDFHDLKIGGAFLVCKSVEAQFSVSG